MAETFSFRRSEESSLKSFLSPQKELKAFILFFSLTELPGRHISIPQIEQQAWEDTNDNKTWLFENFKKKGFLMSVNEGEGNCMFLALSEQLDLKKGITMSQAELRKTVVLYLKKNRTQVSVLGFLTQVIHVCLSLVKISKYILWIL